MASEEQSKTQFFQISRLDSIKTKIIVFALLATIIPTVIMGWVSYVQNRRFLSDNIRQELRVVTAQTSREVALWLHRKLNDARTYTVSDTVLKYREKLFRTDTPHIEKVDAQRRIKDYFRSLLGKFEEYEELILLDLNGKTLATSAKKATPLKMPEKWMETARSDEPIVGQPYLDQSSQIPVMVIATPILAGRNRILGVLAIKLNFKAIGLMLKNYAQGEAVDLQLITKEGILLVSSLPIPMKTLRKIMVDRTLERLFSEEGIPLKYTGYQGKAVVGTLKKVKELEWGVVAEKDRQEAYAEIVRLRNLTLGLFAGVLLLIGLCAYLLGLSIVRPLARLTKGADKVSGGDLEVDLPVLSRSEVGYLTQVFNQMVARLRKGREQLASANEALKDKNKELEILSITDSLTGLYNRKHLMESLTKEIGRSRRYERPFALLIIDIDHFKKFNDAYGHLAGDDVLRKMGNVFRESIRNCDYAARYGGEEFIIFMPEIGQDDGVKAAERIRGSVAKEKIDANGHSVTVTISVGIASFPEHGDDAQAIISKADEALYQAKRRGRDRVVLAGSGRKKKKKKKAAQ
ncbi:MAG: diguanylate cyclase [Desulfobacteraceae bacterium]